MVIECESEGVQQEQKEGLLKEMAQHNSLIVIFCDDTDGSVKSIRILHMQPIKVLEALALVEENFILDLLKN